MASSVFEVRRKKLLSERKLAQATSVFQSAIHESSDFRRNQKFRQALGFCAEARRANPRSVSVAYTAGIICLELGWKGVAAKYFRQALRGDPKNANVMVKLATALWHRPKSARPMGAQARDLCLRALRISPNHLEALLLIGSICSELPGEEEAAIVHYKAFLRVTIGEGPLVRKVIEDDVKRLQKERDARTSGVRICRRASA